jgi:hypothetical protein
VVRSPAGKGLQALPARSLGLSSDRQLDCGSPSRAASNWSRSYIVIEWSSLRRQADFGAYHRLPYARGYDIGIQVDVKQKPTDIAGSKATL